MVTLEINDVDVTSAYLVDEGPIEIIDGLNQPVVCGFSLHHSLLYSLLTGGLIGGELVTVRDSDRIYFDGVVPVEAGIGSEYRYLNGLTGVYEKRVALRAADWQAVLDHVNLPDVTYYYRTAKQILEDLFARLRLPGTVDTSLMIDGYALPEYSVGGRKFSVVVKELAALNGCYFALRTVSLGPRAFRAEFRPVSDRPAPFSVDADANKYEIGTLVLEPRDRPLVNKVTIVGGSEPSSDVHIDTFSCDGEAGAFTLSRLPFYLRTASLLRAEFDGTLASEGASQVGSAFTTSTGLLQGSGSGALFFNAPFQTREQRLVEYRDIVLQSGSAVIFSLTTDKVTNNVSNVELGVWFKSDGSISLIVAGAEVTPIRGNPTWEADTSYFVRLKETSVGTYAEVRGGRLSPTRYWLPLTQPGLQATGWLQAVTGVDPLEAGSTLTVSLGGESGLTTLPAYTLTPADVADTTWLALHEHLATHLNGLALLSDDYRASLQEEAFGAIGVVNTTGVEIQVEFDEPHGWSTGDRIWLESFGVFPDGYRVITVIDPETISLDGTEGDGVTWTSGGTAKKYFARVDLTAWVDGGQFNRPIFMSTPPGLASTSHNLEGGTNPGAPLADTGDFYFAGILSQSGTWNLQSVHVTDPVGVDVRLERALPPTVASGDADLAGAQEVVSLTVGSADQFDESYSAQVALQGDVAVLSFFDDPDTNPKAGDTLRVAYRYEVPVKVTVEDAASQALVRSRSHIPGDTGVREALDVDVKDKVYSRESAIRYGQQWLAARAPIIAQGSVASTSFHTGGAFPQAGQILGIQIDGISRAELVSQVTTTHTRGNHFRFRVSFGRAPDEFLATPESPSLRAKPDALAYDVRTAGDVVRCSDEQITFTEL